MNYFISQPMNGKTNEEILRERNKIILEIINRDKEAIILDSFFINEQNNVNPLYLLGKSLQVLSKADIMYCAKGWNNARGCKIEYDCALHYGITVIEE